MTDKQWQRLAESLPAPKRRGRPRRDDREVLNGILWVLRTGAPWKDMPERYPPYQTCHRRFQSWTEAEVMPAVLERLAQDLHAQGDIDLSECFIDGSFAAAKKGGLRLAKPNAAKVPRLWPSPMLMVFRSPLTYKVLARMRPSLSKALLKQGLLPIFPKDL